jgi:hypothetical protein
VGNDENNVKMDAYLEEELYDILIYCIQNPNASEFESKKKRIEEIGRELYADGGIDAMENTLTYHYNISATGVEQNLKRQE